MKALAAIRVQKIKSMSTIRAAEAHGRRLDEASSRRVDASRTALNLAASQYSPDDPLALEAAYRGFRKATGAVEGKGAAIMAHMIAVISPEVLAETGDPRDPNNPKVRALFEQAQEWARSEFGDESLVASRLDVDEAGAGVVDLFVCPTAMQAGGRGRKPKLTISVKSGLEAIAAKNGNKRSYSAIQDSWGEWASQHIDRRLKRGKPKRETMLQHVHADILREEYEAIDRRKAELDARESALEREEQKLFEDRKKVAVWQDQLEQRLENIEQRQFAARSFVKNYLNGNIERVGVNDGGHVVVTFSAAALKKRPGICKILRARINKWLDLAFEIITPLQRLMDKFSVTLEQRASVAKEAGYAPDDDWDLGNGLGF